MFKKRAPIKWQPLEVHNLEELKDSEPAILERIGALPQGGILFALNPLLLFKDISVHLSEEALSELKAREPRLAHLDGAAYKEFKEQRGVPNVRVRVRGLFRSTRQ